MNFASLLVNSNPNLIWTLIKKFQRWPSQSCQDLRGFVASAGRAFFINEKWRILLMSDSSVFETSLPKKCVAFHYSISLSTAMSSLHLQKHCRRMELTFQYAEVLSRLGSHSHCDNRRLHTNYEFPLHASIEHNRSSLIMHQCTLLAIEIFMTGFVRQYCNTLRLWGIKIDQNLLSLAMCQSPWLLI